MQHTVYKPLCSSIPQTDTANYQYNVLIAISPAENSKFFSTLSPFPSKYLYEITGGKLLLFHSNKIYLTEEAKT